MAAASGLFWAAALRRAHTARHVDLHGLMQLSWLPLGPALAMASVEYVLRTFRSSFRGIQALKQQRYDFKKA